MKLAYLASAFFPDLSPMWMLTESAARHDIPIQYYGLGRPFTGTVDTKIDALLPELDRLIAEGYTHVLYTDGNDTFFVRGPAQILHHYRVLGSPAWLLSAEKDCYPHTDLVGKVPVHLRYPNTGQYMGEIEAIAETWKVLRNIYGPGDNEQGWICRAFADEIVDYARVDTDRLIFRSAADDYAPHDSGCVLHFNGGYSAPGLGVGRMARMGPVWERLGY